MKSISQVINVLPIHENIESIEQQIMEINQNDLHSKNTGESISYENEILTNLPTTKVKSVSRIINVLPIHENKESFE